MYLGHSLSFYYPDLQLWMFEDKNLSVPAERERFLQLVDRLNLQSSLRLFSNVPNADMMANYSLIGDSGGFLCSTSKVEGAPLSILEAMSCRCPVLATYSDGVTASIIHNYSGKNYHLGNLGQAVQEARDLIENPERREAIKNDALLHLKAEFGPEQFYRNFMHMLQTV
ncbi:UDP-D-galactose:(glucosyl)lipopolysaccharide-1,6-D-galactosyltransferase [compost metagenome]